MRTSRRGRATRSSVRSLRGRANRLESRALLDERIVELASELRDDPVPRPPTWGGFRLVPAAWEFWQHRSSRLHDRFRYEREPSGSWRVERLFP